MWLFAKKKSPSEILRENKRMLDKSMRELDRERTSMMSQEKRLIAEIKKMAKANQMGAVKVMAKDLVRTRHSITKFYALKSQLQGVSLRMQTLKSTQAMGDAMRGVTQAMKSMNKTLNMPTLNNILKEFEKQNERMDMTTEVMGEVIDDAFAGEDEEEETDELVNAVLDELGCSIGGQLVDAPALKVSAPASKEQIKATAVLEGGGGGSESQGAPGGGVSIGDDLQARLDRLRGN